MKTLLFLLITGVGPMTCETPDIQTLDIVMEGDIIHAHSDNSGDALQKIEVLSGATVVYTKYCSGTSCAGELNTLPNGTYTAKVTSQSLVLQETIELK